MPVAAILGFDDVYASVLGGYADMLQVANAHLRKQGGRDASGVCQRSCRVSSCCLL
jgi:hypothetical protein